MKRLPALAISFSIGFLLTAGFLLCRYPNLTRYYTQKVIPSVRVFYSAEEMMYADMFNDRQSKQMAAAREYGLKKKPMTRSDLASMSKELTVVKSGEAFRVQPLSHSVYQLRPNALAELETIGLKFRASLKEKKLPDYRIQVTSLLRTQEDVDRLTKVNSNATVNSCHSYGTTFDISYTHFERISITRRMGEEDLKKILAEVLEEEKAMGNIYVKYETKQRCFHITVRK